MMARAFLLLLAAATTLASSPGKVGSPGFDKSAGLGRSPDLTTPTVDPPTTVAEFIAQNKGNNSLRLAADVKDEERLVGPTQVATTDNYPFAVYIKVTLPDGTFADCGGSIITDSYVLTAAQCVVQAATITVLAGTFDSSTATSPAPTLPIQARVGAASIHPGFRRRVLINDIALVKIFIPFTISGVVAPVKLLMTNKKVENYNVRVLGWGPATVSTTIVTNLNYEDMTVLPKTDCDDKMLEMWMSYASTHQCLDTSNKEKGFCYGDTGGPVLYKFSGDSSYTLVGIMSDYPTCPSSYPDAFTPVFPYIAFIKQYVKKGLLT